VTPQDPTPRNVDEAYDRLIALAPELAPLVEAHGGPDPFSWRPLRSYAAALLWACASAQVSARR